MSLPLPRVSIARMMAWVLGAAIGCFLGRVFLMGGLGFSTIGVALSLGVLGILNARGRKRRFAIGFVGFGLVSAFAFYAVLFNVNGAIAALAHGYIEPSLDQLPLWLTDRQWANKVTFLQGSSEPAEVIPPSRMALAIVEGLIGVPWLLLVCLGGALMTWIGPGARRVDSTFSADAVTDSFR